MFEEFYSKKIVIVWRKNNFKNQGLFLSENELGIFIDDIKNGKTFIPFDEISEIREVGKGG